MKKLSAKEQYKIKRELRHLLHRLGIKTATHRNSLTLYDLTFTMVEAYYLGSNIKRS